MSYDPTEEDGTVECPECGMDYSPDFELNEQTVYVCGHCGTELVCTDPTFNEMAEYWGEFWEEIADGEGEDNAPRVTLGRKQEQMSEVGRMLFGAMTEMNKAMYENGGM